MLDFSNYIVWIVILALLLGLFLLFKGLSKRNKRASAIKFVAEAIEQAMTQSAPFDIKISGQTGLSGKLLSITEKALVLKANRPVSDNWVKTEAEVYFRVLQEQGPLFYVFTTHVVSVEQEAGELTLNYPAHLRVEKKRHFNRVRPPLDQIKMIAVWPATPGKRLPRTNSDLGKPPLSWKNGQHELSAQIENIAGSGLALKLDKDRLEFEPAKGKHIICLIVFASGNRDDDKTIFWCTCEIMNVRQDGGSISLGLEFINWAIQEPGENEIRWTHNSPWRGVKPILQWVQQLERNS